MNTWNGLDFFIFLIFAVCTIRGMARGASKEIVSMMCLSVALIFTIKFTVPLTIFFLKSPLIVDVLDSKYVQSFMLAIGVPALTANFINEISYSLSVLICFVGVFSICEAGLHYTAFVETFTFPYAAMSRKVGGALGATRGYVFSLILILILSLHLFRTYDNAEISSAMSGSFFVNLFHNSAVKLDNIIGSQDVDRYRDIYNDKNLYNATDVMKAVGTEPETQTPPPPQPDANQPSNTPTPSTAPATQNTQPTRKPATPLNLYPTN